jgi:type II secretory pathway component PulC
VINVRDDLDKYMQQTAFFSVIGLAILTCLTLFYDLWQWHSDWRLIHQPLPPLHQVTTSQIINLDNIPAAHLFGKPLAKITDVPISSLHLQVTGIVKVENGQEEHDSKVYLSISGQPSKIYRIGDNVSGVKIYSITPDTVILENNGRFEKLPLHREKLQFKPFQKGVD